MFSFQIFIRGIQKLNMAKTKKKKKALAKLSITQPAAVGQLISCA